MSKEKDLGCPMSEITELQLRLEMLKKKEAEDKLAAKKPSKDGFIHNTNVIECLDRFTSSEVVLPISKDSLTRLDSRRERPWNLNRIIREADKLWQADVREGKTSGRQEVKANEDKNAHLYPYMDDENVQLLKESYKRNWLTSDNRKNLCHTNARQDVLASQQAEGLRAYLEALHRNVVILEKRLVTLEEKTGHL